MAKNNVEFLLKTQWKDGILYRNYKKGQSSIPGFLEDYCFLIEALWSLHQADLDERWLYTAKDLCDQVIDLFYDNDKGYFFFKSKDDEPLISRPIEIEDNVMPSSNSSMAKNLWVLGTLLDDTSYLAKAHQLLSNVSNAMPAYGSAFSNWGITYLNLVKPPYVVALTGEDYIEMKQELEQAFPYALYIGSNTSSKLPLMEGKINTENTIFVCSEGTCQLPVHTTQEAIEQLRK